MSENRKRKSRLFLTPHLLLLVSTLLYFFPYFVGSFEFITPTGQRFQQNYSQEVGLVVFFVLSMLAAIALGIERRSIEIGGRTPRKSESLFLLLALLSLLAYVIVEGNIFSLSKSEMLEGTNRIHLAFYQVSALSFVYCILTGYNKNTLLFVLSVLCLLLILYAGHRSALLIAAVSAAYIYFRSTPITRRFLTLCIVAALAFFFLSTYKSVYIAIKSGDWDLVVTRLSFENIAASMLVGMEQFLTFAHLDFVVSSGFRLACSNFWIIPFTVVPFMDDILGPILNLRNCDYNAQIQPIFFSGYSGGVAANVWAEFFGLFGYIGLPILIALLSFFFYTLEYFIRRLRSPIMVSSLIIALVNMSFYIQRKELLGGFISAKRAVLIAFIIFFVIWFLRKATSRRKVVTLTDSKSSEAPHSPS